MIRKTRIREMYRYTVDQVYWLFLFSIFSKKKKNKKKIKKEIKKDKEERKSKN